MPIAIGQTGQAPLSQLADRSRLTNDEFMKVLITQLTTQDPTKPLSNEEMIAQLVTLQELQNSQDVSKVLQQLSLEAGLTRFETQFTSAATMIGYWIKGENLQGVEVEGVAEKVTVEGGQVMIWVRVEGEETLVPVPFTNILEVKMQVENGEEGEA